MRQLNIIYLSLVSLFSPLLSIIISLKLRNNNYVKNTIWFFCVFSSYNYVIGNKESDINRYKERFETHVFSDLTVLEFVDKEINDGNFDFLQPTLSFIFAHSTFDFRAYLILIGFIYGYLFSHNVKLILDLSNVKLKLESLFFILLFSVIFAFWDINVMRFTLAAQSFVYGWFCMNLLNKRNLGLFFIFISILFHFSFIIMALLTFIYRMIGKENLKVYFIIFLFSVIYSGLSLDFFTNYLNLLPEQLVDRSSGYLSSELAEYRTELVEEKNFRGKFYQDSLYIGISIIMAYVFFNRKRLIVNELGHILVGFSFFSLGVSKILAIIPSMNRFLFVSYMFCIALMLFIFTDSRAKKDKRLIYCVLPLLLFYFVVKFRVGMEFTSIQTFFGGLVLSIFVKDSTPLIEYLK